MAWSCGCTRRTPRDRRLLPRHGRRLPRSLGAGLGLQGPPHPLGDSPRLRAPASLLQQLLHSFYSLLFNGREGGVGMPLASTRPLRRSAGPEDEAIRFAGNLARTFGVLARFHVCRSTPPTIVGSSEAAKQVGDVGEVLSAVRDFAAGSRVENRPAGRGIRLSVL